jgi:hypothetical protein
MKKTLFTVAAAAAFILGGPVLVAPSASADTLPNGYSITCTPNGSQLICNVSGCPRVFGDEAGDVVHIKMDDGYQNEPDKNCNNTTTATFSNVSPNPHKISIQGCRKHDLSSDDCGPWSDYTYIPPAPPQAPAGPPVMSNAGDPVKCVGCGAPAPAPVPDVINAIQASFGQPGLTSVDFTVTNTSNLDAVCHYTATANSLNPLVPKKTTRQFDVPANQTVVQPFNGAPTLTNYSVTLSCNDASGKQKAEMGHVDTSVLW